MIINSDIKIQPKPFKKVENKNFPIKCIFFCEFHHKTGRELTYQVPENFISKETFDSLSVYLIPKEELEGSLITLNAKDLKVIGFPVGINDPKFPRNKLIFNLCLVCVPTAETLEYESVVEKLAHYLINLETESAFLYNKETKAKLPYYMQQIKDQLNQTKSCILPITESITIYLKVPTVHPEPNQVDELDVPIFFTKTIKNLDELDLTTQQIIPFIDGFRHVEKIAYEAEVEVSLVKAAIQNLIYYDLIRLIPIFQYSNAYFATPKLVELVENASLQEECLKFVRRNEDSKVNFRKLFQFICAMNSGVTIKDLCLRFSQSLIDMDEKKLIRFCVLHGLIRRLQKYPVFTFMNPESIHYQRGLYKFFDGKHTFDKICSSENKTHQEIEQKVEKHSGVVVCWK